MNITEFKSKIGESLGTSNWVLVDQARINAFADVTEDHQFIHVDPDRARQEAGLDGTIAHGYLTLSLLSQMSFQVLPKFDGLETAINYGLNRLRFLHPVPSGARIRAHFVLAKVSERHAGAYLVECDVRVEIEGIDTPALLVTTLGLYR